MSIKLIEDAYQSITSYSSLTGRLGLQDLIVFDSLLNLLESDMDNLDEYLWTTTPDEVMQYIIDINRNFTIDFGWDDLIADLRFFMLARGFIVMKEDLTEKQYNDLIETGKYE